MNDKDIDRWFDEPEPRPEREVDPDRERDEERDAGYEEESC